MSNSCPSINCSECSFRSAVFESLSEEQFNQLTNGKIINEAPKGTLIARQDDQVKNFIFLRVGLAKLTRVTADGREQIIGIATPNDFVGLLSIFSSKTYQYSIVAVEDSQFCSVDYGIILALIKCNGRFAENLLEKFSKVSDSLINTRLDLNLLQLRGRVAFILCFFANEVYKSNKYILPISRKEIAELIDMRVENVVRMLTELRHDNIIATEGTAVEIKDPAKLEWIRIHG